MIRVKNECKIDLNVQCNREMIWNPFFLHHTVQCLFVLQQSSLCAVLTWPLFNINDINLVCSIVFCFGVVAPIVVCEQHTEKPPRVNFLQLCSDLVCSLKDYPIPLTLGWEESEKSSSLECTCAIRGTSVPSPPFASSSFTKITISFYNVPKNKITFLSNQQQWQCGESTVGGSDHIWACWNCELKPHRSR